MTNSTVRTPPTASTDFPVYRVRAKCRCGKKGWANSFVEHDPGTVLAISCRKCCAEYEARVAELSRLRPKSDKPKSSRSSQPSRDTSHWTDKLP